MITRLLTVASIAAVTGCTHHGMHALGTHAEPDPARGVVPLTDDSPLVAVVTPVGGSEVSGVIRFARAGEGVRVTGTVSGLTPNSKHGFHVHAYGDATNTETGASAGVHFNPFGTDHALAGAAQGHDHDGHTAHAGDFPNLEADDTGTATIDFIARTTDLTVGPAAILGRSLIIHEKEDVGDQPWGGAGGRIAIGIIGLANPEAMPADGQ